LGVRNLYDNLADLMEVEEERGVRSTFFIPAVLFNLDEVEGCLKQLVEGAGRWASTSWLRGGSLRPS
jgi:hypothetical protein